MYKLRSVVAKHPYLTAFAVLALAMEAILFAAARDVALAPTQYGAIAVATALLAGLCVWIITWE